MKIIRIILGVCLLALMMNVKAFGQQVTDTVGIGKMSRDLSISPEKAVALRAAMQINRAEIRAVISDHAVSGAEKQRRLKQLMAVRDSSINLLLTPQESQKLKSIISSRLTAEGQIQPGQ